jgi:hypothetical protein
MQNQQLSNHQFTEEAVSDVVSHLTHLWKYWNNSQLYEGPNKLHLNYNAALLATKGHLQIFRRREFWQCDEGDHMPGNHVAEGTSDLHALQTGLVPSQLLVHRGQHNSNEKLLNLLELHCLSNVPSDWEPIASNLCMLSALSCVCYIHVTYLPSMVIPSGQCSAPSSKLRW